MVSLERACRRRRRRGRGAVRKMPYGGAGPRMYVLGAARHLRREGVQRMPRRSAESAVDRGRGGGSRARRSARKRRGYLHSQGLGHIGPQEYAAPMPSRSAILDGGHPGQPCPGLPPVTSCATAATWSTHSASCSISACVGAMMPYLPPSMDTLRCVARFAVAEGGRRRRAGGGNDATEAVATFI